MNRAVRDAEPSTSVSLLQRVQDGDAESWQRLAQVYGPIVYGWARRCGCQSADAADVMQETFASVAGAVTRFDHDTPGATFRGWLWTIARNKMRDRARREHEQAVGGTAAQLAMQQLPQGEDASSQLVDAKEPPSALESDTVAARRRTLEMLRTSFDARSWRMFWETAIERRQPDHVAEEMGVSRWAVYKARARVLQRLQREMQGLE